MRILRIIYDWPPPWQGLAPHPYELTVSQANKGHKIELFCGRWPSAGPIEQPEGVTPHTIMREPVPNSIAFTSSVLLFIKYYFWRKNKKNQVDIIHSHGHFGIWIYLYRRILQKYFPWSDELMTPLVVHFHNTSEGRKESLEKAGKDVKPDSQYVGWPLMAFSDKLATQVASACVFVSNETMNEAIKFYGVDPNKCFVIESGVNLDLFKRVSGDERDKSRRDLRLDVYDKVVLYHGALVERKNPHLLLEALDFLPPHYKLLIVGSGEEAYEQKIKDIIKNKHLEDRVLKVGYTPYPLTPISYQISDLFVLPSTWEGLPKVVMQGLACGIPCLVSGFKLSEPLKGLYYLDNLSPDFIAKKIIEIVENPSEVDSGKIGSFYSWDKRADELDKVYEYAGKHYL
jgi:glycosyltransferase involved in cell wall biosynthesis